MIRKIILLKGLVQGIGFRPFVYREAVERNLKGFVRNSTVGVVIDIEGDKKSIDNFIKVVKYQGPELLKIEEITIKEEKIANYKNFTINKSTCEDQGITFIPPDLGICKECYKDIMDTKNKRYRYPFTNCTNCGPRYSVINHLPYDRKFTTMKSFKMCKDCNDEYKYIQSRRFHAETNCCSKCGPELFLVDKLGNNVQAKNPINEAARLIKAGRILSIKGIGGYHLACNGKDEEAINLLRERKGRLRKPFALMIKDIETVKKYCHVSEKEEEILNSNKRPIVILDKKGEALPDNIARGNKTLGVMLPYTPLHYLLFQENLDVLIMTSANINSMPIVYKDKEVIDTLGDIADYHLMNNREIFNSVDDSVVRVVLERERVIRLGRGYSPTYLNGIGYKETLSLGSHLKNTFSLCRNEKIILSQYIGDLENKETLSRYDKAIKTLVNIHKVNPQLIAYDLHPRIFSEDYLNNFQGKKVGIYHHHAHIASVLFENHEKDKVIGVAYDGVGYGSDGTSWGGEFLVCDCVDFERLGHLNTVLMPGGDMAAKEPMRMAMSYLYKAYKEDIKQELYKLLVMQKCYEEQHKLAIIEDYNQKFQELVKSRNYSEEIFKATSNKNYKEKPSIDSHSLNHYKSVEAEEKIAKMYLKIIKKAINSPITSSMGRFFDAVSYILGFKDKITYEGEAAIYLENLALSYEVYDTNFSNKTNSYESINFYKRENHRENKACYDFDIETINEKYIINTDNIIIGIVQDLKENVPRELIALRFHDTVIDFTVDMCEKISENCGIKKVALSGGVFQNKILLTGIYKKLTEKFFIVYTNKQIPCNDGGISFGQLVIANEREKAQ